MAAVSKQECSGVRDAHCSLYIGTGIEACFSGIWDCMRTPGAVSLSSTYKVP